MLIASKKQMKIRNKQEQSAQIVYNSCKQQEKASKKQMKLELSKFGDA